MSEARKCDRCHGFYDIAEEQQDRKTPYEFKGDYINLHLWVARNGVRRDLESRWYDLCPKCMIELECWLKNNDFPTICEPDNEADVEQSFIKDVTKVEDILPDKIIPDEPYNSFEEYKDPCKSCHNGVCEQCVYGYCSEEDKKKRWLENHKDEVKLSDPYEDGGL